LVVSYVKVNGTTDSRGLLAIVHGRASAIPLTADSTLRPVTDEPQPYALALEEARRGLDQQMTDLDGIRNRTGTVLGLAGLAASLIGGLTGQVAPEPSAWSWVAVSAFVGVAVLSVVILWPRKVRTTQDPKKLVTWAETDNVTADAMHRDLSLYMGTQYDGNWRTLHAMMWAYCAALVLLVVEIIALILDVRSI